VLIFPTYKDRIDILYKLKELNPKTVCEVGVQRGEYSRQILSVIPSIEKIYLVDLWKHQENYFDHANVDDVIQQQCLEATISNTNEWKEKVVPLKGYSTEMVKSIPDQSLDWVYIDARHDYKGCLEDLEAYWPKVKSGGIMSGHDYMSADEVHGQDWSINYDGTRNIGAVKGAVDYFAATNNLQILLSYKEPAWHTWTLLKD
jgi:predicted O-methyltransferase YrrM